MNILVKIFGLVFPAFAAIICICFGKNIKFSQRYYIFYGFALGGIGYTFFPKNTIDYVRYIEQINYISSSGSLFDVFISDPEKLFFRDVVFYFIGQINNNQLLAVLVATVTYSIVSYVFFDIINNTNKKLTIKINTLTAFIVFIISISTVSIFTVISLTRNILCFSVMFLGLYLEIIKKKRTLSYAIYVLMLFFHHSAFIFIIARILILIIKINIIYLITPLIFIVMLYLLSMMNIDGASENFLLIILRRILGYWENNTQGWGKEMFKYYSETFDFFYQVAFTFINTSLLLRTKNGENNELVRFCFIINLIAISTIFINPGVFSRFVALQSLFFVVVYAQLKINGFDKISCVVFYILCGMSLLKITSNIICYINFIDTTNFFEKYLLGGIAFM